MQVKILAEEIAAIKGIKFQELARITTDNAKRFFNLK
jgi:Tat protein secretion system quality control protein TatD with DNase activity